MDVGAFRDDARHFGVARALLRAAAHRVQAACGLRLFRYLVLEPDHVNPELLRRPLPYECRFLSAPEIAGVVRDPDLVRVSGMPRADDLCFAISDGATVASVGWYATRPTRLAGTATVHFDSRYVYMYGGYTAPPYRGQHLHGIGLARATALLGAHGHAGVVSIAESVNFASLASCDRIGFRRCGTVLVVPVRGRLVVRQSRAAARSALRLAPLAVGAAS